MVIGRSLIGKEGEELVWDSIPYFGVGLGYRREVRQGYFEHKDRIDWLELIADHYLSAIPERVEEAVELSAHFKLIPHGLEMSVGTDGPLDMEYLRQVKELLDVTKAPFYSDHLCMTKADGIEMGQLVTLHFNDATAMHCAEKASQVQDSLGVPFLLENISYPFCFPGNLSEPEFITKVLEESGCGLLLDLTNLFINSQNHKYDPFAFLDSIPLERAVQIHIAGGEKRGGVWVDTHAQPVDSHPQVWELLDYVVNKKRAPVKAVLLERDQNFPENFADIAADLDKSRLILEQRRAN